MRIWVYELLDNKIETNAEAALIAHSEVVIMAVIARWVESVSYDKDMNQGKSISEEEKK